MSSGAVAKQEPESSPPPMASGVVANDTPYMNMTLSDLISKLREAEEEVEKKEIEIGWLKERVKFEMLYKMKAEEELKGQRKKEKEAEERYTIQEGLLEVVKNQNRELSGELKKSLEAKKKIEEEQGSTIAKLKGVISELQDENGRNEGIWKRKFFELNERVLKLEILMKDDCGDDFRVPSDSTCSRRNEDTNQNKDELGASSGGGKLRLGTIIEIESDDDDDDDVSL